MTVLLDSQTADTRIEPERFRRTADRLLEYSGWSESELSILLVDDPRIAELNQSYRRKDGPTNVLSFPLLDPDDRDIPVLLGDIVISVETAVREAVSLGTGIDDYMTILLVHGFVHLLGYDHEKGEDEAGEMAAEEKKLLKTLQRDGLLNLEADSLLSI